MSSRADDAYVLCGGQSRRMGRDKATLPLAGKRLVDWVIETIVEAGFRPHIVFCHFFTPKLFNLRYPLDGVVFVLRHI